MKYQRRYTAPNLQNLLLEFDKNFRPTGGIFIRDVSDVYYVPILAKAAGKEHDRAYFEVFNQALGTNFDYTNDEAHTELFNFLASDAGQEAYRSYLQALQ